MQQANPRVALTRGLINHRIYGLCRQGLIIVSAMDNKIAVVLRYSGAWLLKEV